MKNNSLLIFIGIFCLYFFFFISLFFLVTFYLHETGHIFFGFTEGLLNRNINNFEITSWISHPILPFIKLPQQTKIVDGKAGLNFLIGGPMFMILIFFGLSLLGYFRSKDIKWFLLFISISLFEIFGNIICGTDNFKNNTLSSCNQLLNINLQWFAIFLFSVTLSFFTTKKIISRLNK